MRGCQYRRPQWTGAPLVYSDGQVDEEFAECPSCLSFHAASNLACNGKREPCSERCTHELPGRLRCDRPANHLGEHDAIVEGCRVTWHPWRPTTSASGAEVK